MSDLQKMVAIWTAAAATASDPVIYQLFRRLIREAQVDQHKDTVEIRGQNSTQIRPTLAISG